MRVEELHYQTRFEYNKLVNNHNASLTDVDIDNVLNMSVDDYIDMFFYGKNLKGFNVGFETDQQRIEMLHSLVSDTQIPAIATTGNKYKFSLVLNQNVNKYGDYISGTVEVKNCPGKYLELHIAQHNDQVELDFHRKTSLKWERVNGLFKSDFIEIDTHGEFVPTVLNLTYLKKPNVICLGTYQDLYLLQTIPNPPNKVKVECDLPEKYHKLLTKIAVLNLDRIYGTARQSELPTLQHINSLT